MLLDDPIVGSIMDLIELGESNAKIHGFTGAPVDLIAAVKKQRILRCHCCNTRFYARRDQAERGWGFCSQTCAKNGQAPEVLSPDDVANIRALSAEYHGIEKKLRKLCNELNQIHPNIVAEKFEVHASLIKEIYRQEKHNAAY